MSGAVTATTVLATAAAVGTAYTIYSGEKAAKAQKSAQQEARNTAVKQEKAADEAMNAANRKTPNTAAIMDRAAQMGKSGPASTMITGAGGVDPNQLALGRNTLLGG
jgi:arginine exporter protein ArgO